ncbi:DUF448 domain-containing protein [Chrysiogenes arsenatis]|uniref:DUF448 domain-containing protein n=1 Tax=Chrysiogenes arsenatis TaxID=309797 RepID=UPI0003F82F9C|nr:DUF448 domain-containing protein [Chrysiogenes arsenatis]
MKQAERTCIVCREKHEKSTFVRLCLAPTGELVWDLRHKLPGRGASLCLNWNCLRKGIQHKKITTALRTTEIAPYQEREKIAELMQLTKTTLLNYVKIGIKAGKAFSGYTKVMQVLTRERVSLVLLARDISPSRRRNILTFVHDRNLKLINIFQQSELGELFQADDRSCVVICDAGIAESMNYFLELYRILEEGSATWQN